MKRVFLTRVQATYALGLMDAGLRREPRGVRVACRDPKTGKVFEAQDDEVLHSQIAIRANLSGCAVDGWTISERMAANIRASTGAVL